MKILISGKARIKLKELIALQKTGPYLRIACLGGGCVGLNYLLKVEEIKKNDDMLLTIDGLNVIIDPKSAIFLDGLEIDYSTSLSNMGYVFKNPNAKQSCSCGLSFTV